MAKKNKITEEKPIYEHESLQKIEERREVFLDSYNKHNTYKFIVMLVCLIAIIVAFIVLPTIMTGPLQSAVTLCVAAAALGGTFGYSVYVRKKFDKKMKDYFELYFQCINEYAFDDKKFSNVELQTPGKITLEEFNDCKLYKDVTETGSRGLTTFKYGNLDMSIVDCAGNVKVNKRIAPVFVGKMVRAKSNYKSDKPIFIYLKGNERALPPTNVENVKNVSEDESMVVYSDNKDWKKVVTPAVTKAIKAVKTDQILVDLAISIQKDKVFVMLGYDDPLMVLPLQNQFDVGPTNVYKKNLLEVAKIVEELNK